jgi:hypothetical protein
VIENEPPDPSQWSEEKRRELRRSLEKRRERQVQASRVFAGVLIAVAAAGILLRLPESWWVPAVGVVALAGLGFRLTNWKCPACGERLPTRGSGRTCRGCGLPLE